MTSEERREARYRRRRARREAQKMEKAGDALDFDRVFTFGRLYRSAQMCYRHVCWKASVQAYKAHGGINTMRRYKEIKSGKLSLTKGPEFVIYERGHRRLINGIHIRDRVPQKCMCHYSLKPVLHRTLIYDNYSSQEKKGITLARKRLECKLQQHIRRHGMTGGMLVFDFKSYFDSIQHRVIWHILGRNYSDKRIIGMNMKTVRYYRKDVGLILGSENSQDFAISVPNYLDHCVMEKLGAEAYGRYADDGWAIFTGMENLRKAKESIERIAEALGLRLNVKKTRVIRFGEPFRFLKTRYSFTETGKIIKRPDHSSVVRMRRKLKRFYRKFLAGKMPLADIRQSMESWEASVAHTRCYKAVGSIRGIYNQLFIEPFIRGEEMGYVLQDT